jgi:hypothetical protein
VNIVEDSFENICAYYQVIMMAIMKLIAANLILLAASQEAVVWSDGSVHRLNFGICFKKHSSVKPETGQWRNTFRITLPPFEFEEKNIETVLQAHAHICDPSMNTT